MFAPKTINSLGDFVQRISDLRQHWGLKSHQEMWFRGEEIDYKTTRLRPGLYRNQSKPIKELLNIENDLHGEFQRCAIQLLDGKSEDENWKWDSYFLMQHHNVPTRLLDWSDGALMGLHFALRNKMANSMDAAIVYVLEPYRLDAKIKLLKKTREVRRNWASYVESNPTQRLYDDAWEDSWLPSDIADRVRLPVPESPMVLDFPHISRRVAAQRSRFVVFGQDPNCLSDLLDTNDPPIMKIIINAKKSATIRRELRDNGITESVIYPDLDGLGRELRQIWENRVHE